MDQTAGNTTDPGTTLDWSAVPSAELNSKGPEVGRIYDPRPHEDLARRRIAYALIALLCGLVLAIVVLLAVGRVKVTEVKEFSTILGPIVTLVSAATGFYYGTKSNGR